VPVGWAELSASAEQRTPSSAPTTSSRSCGGVQAHVCVLLHNVPSGMSVNAPQECCLYLNQLALGWQPVLSVRRDLVSLAHTEQLAAAAERFPFGAT
jgi:hypothetical protein